MPTELCPGTASNFNADLGEPPTRGTGDKARPRACGQRANLAHCGKGARQALTDDLLRYRSKGLAAASAGPSAPTCHAGVDDNEDAAMLLGDLLRSVGHDVRVAHDGESAIDAATRFQPEIAILDIGLPDMDGYELAVAIRERLETKVRLMAFTGYGQQNDVARTKPAGFEAHFVKPVALAKLLTEIEMSRSARS